MLSTKSQGPSKTLIIVVTMASFLSSSAALAQSKSKKVDYTAMTHEMMQNSFRTEGLVKKEVLNQDETQKACSTPDALHSAHAKKLRAKIEKINLETIVYPADNKFMGDWKNGEKIAQSGRGLTYTDDEKVVTGGGCYNCHQISPKEISFGTIGPSLYNYGKIRGNSPEIIKYTWGKIYNAKAYNACSDMPRNGYGKIITEDNIRDLMALLLDPESPVNK